MRNVVYSLFGVVFLIISFKDSYPFKKLEYYEIRTYYFENKYQETLLDQYLEHALLPALHRLKINKVGFFKPIANDTGVIKKIIVFIPFKQIMQFLSMDEKLEKDQQYLRKGQEYISSPYTKPAYKRIEKMLLKAFSKMPVSKKPNLKSPSTSKVYELRSYESASENIYRNKVHMFNEGGEIDLFKQLGFNAIFYAEVLTGNRLPNLMYMTCFENMDERNSHWKKFAEDTAWKKLSSMPQYQKNVSRSEIILMRSTVYSDL
ncbi:MAG: NIPSNAP family protein [Chitinophagaceae bacterium]